ncbi:MAG: hypothetical protein GWM87_01950 [Xanthomonadales bacterium]|nr:hypothetical protein [Xanthomonadales bacterium]NIX11842.1 hypothetical protein [Xanthomonadales bacterium]
MWLITLLLLAGLPATVSAWSGAPPYAIVPANSSTEQATPPSGKRAEQHGHWIEVGSQPTFLLRFADVVDGTGTGFDDPDRGASRQAVAIEAFERLSTLLAGEPGSARIRVDSRSPWFDDQTLAIGVPFFRCRDGFEKPIIFDALRNGETVHTHEGELLVNFSLPLNASMDPPARGEYDLFTLIFHEIAHILGFVGFAVEADGRPEDCGGARMLPAIAEHAFDDRGGPLWILEDGRIRFTGGANDLPRAGASLPLWFPEAVQPDLRLSTSDLRVSGHWRPEDFEARSGVLMLREPFPTGETRRNLTPETKIVLESALGYEVNEEPRGLTGTWYDPGSAGQGFTLHFINREQFLVYFFGFTDARERLWLLGLHDAPLQLGEELSLELFEAQNGRFNGFRAEEVQELPWGTLEINFRDCLNASAVLTGMDGTQTLDLVQLAGVDELECY